MSLNLDLFCLLNIYYFDNLVFVFDRFSVFNEINDVLFIFLYSFIINKSLIFYKDDFKKSFFNSNKNISLSNSTIIFFYKYLLKTKVLFRKFN